MRWFSGINTFLVALLILLFFSCGKDLTPCECGRNLSKSFDEIDQDLEVKCEDYVLKLSNDQRKIWNKEVLDCTLEK